MSRAALTKKPTMARHPARATPWVLVVGAAALLLAVNVYLLWVGYMPRHFSWQTLADPGVSERMLAPAEWLVSRVAYLRSIVPLPMDGNPPAPLTMVEPKTWLA